VLFWSWLFILVWQHLSDESSKYVVSNFCTLVQREYKDANSHTRPYNVIPANRPTRVSSPAVLPASRTAPLDGVADGVDATVGEFEEVTGTVAVPASPEPPVLVVVVEPLELEAIAAA
jgi:hypothetical protein